MHMKLPQMQSIGRVNVFILLVNAVPIKFYLDIFQVCSLILFIYLLSTIPTFGYTEPKLRIYLVS